MADDQKPLQTHCACTLHPRQSRHTSGNHALCSLVSLLRRRQGLLVAHRCTGVYSYNGAQAQLTTEAAAVAREIAKLSAELPAYVWLVALPQLISRATHSHAHTAEATRKIITSVFLHYPDQVC